MRARRALLLFPPVAALTMGTQQPPQKTYLITGSTDGIGRFTALKVAKDGHNVFIHGRSADKVEAVVARIREEGGTASGFVADLSSLAAVRQLGADVKEALSSSEGGLDGLLCNAGTFDGDYTGGRRVTADGNEYSLAVNVLAPFLLVSLLLDEVQKRQGRVLVTSSISQGCGDALEDLQCEKRWSAHRAYSLSKLCDAMIIFELHARYGGRLGVNFLTMDPGTVNTKMLAAGWGNCGIPVTSATRSYDLLTSPDYAHRSGEIFAASPDREVLDARKRAALWDDLTRLTGAVYPPVASEY